MTYLRARYYDSSIRRFISEDPIRDGLNWYAYCSNNPVMFIDPSGLLEEKDYQFSPGVVGYLVLYTFKYLAGQSIGEPHLSNEAAEASTALRNTSSREYMHGQLNRLTQIYLAAYSEYNGIGVFILFINSLKQYSNESNVFSGDGGAIGGAIGGPLGELIGTLATSGDDAITADLLHFENVCAEFSRLQNEYGGEISMEIKEDGYSVYLEVAFESYDGYVRTKEECLKEVFEQTVLSSFP